MDLGIGHHLAIARVTVTTDTVPGGWVGVNTDIVHRRWRRVTTDNVLLAGVTGRQGLGRGPAQGV